MWFRLRNRPAVHQGLSQSEINHKMALGPIGVAFFQCRSSFKHHCRSTYPFTVRVDSLPHRKWKEIKQQPGTAGPGNMLGCCLIYFHFRWDKLSKLTVVLTWSGAYWAPLWVTWSGADWGATGGWFGQHGVGADWGAEFRGYLPCKD